MKAHVGTARRRIVHSLTTTAANVHDRSTRMTTHTIKSTDGPEAFNSPALDSGGHFGFAFHHAGTYHYVCTCTPICTE